VYKILFPDDEDIPLPCEIYCIVNPTLFANLTLGYPTSPVARRNSPGSADFANFEEYQRNALYQRMEHVVESLEETLRSELLARLRDAIAEIPQEYQRQRQRHAVTSNPVAIQDNNETNTDTTSEHSALGVVESPSIEHPVDAMFRLPPPPVNFVSEGDYQTTGLQQANANNANLQAFGSSQNSVSNPFSATSHNGRAPESSRTSLSHSQVRCDISQSGVSNS
jgi:hypothetical protein